MTRRRNRKRNRNMCTNTLFAEADGNSQFRALAKIFHQKQKHHAFVRSKIVQEMRANPNIYFDVGSSVYGWMTSRDAYDQYVGRMSRDTCWGDKVALKAAANLYHVRILSFSSRKKEVMFEVCPSDDMYYKDVYLSWLDGGNSVHYNAAFVNTEMPPADLVESSPSDRPSSLMRFHSYKDNVRLRVSNIDGEATESQLQAKFAEHGVVLDVRISKRNDVSEGFGVAVVESEMDATSIMKELNHEVFMGKELHIQLASEVWSPYDYIVD